MGPFVFLSNHMKGPIPYLDIIYNLTRLTHPKIGVYFQMGPEIQSCDWWTQKKGPIPDLDSFPSVPKDPIVSQTLIQLNTRVGLQTICKGVQRMFVQRLII